MFHGLECVEVRGQGCEHTFDMCSSSMEWRAAREQLSAPANERSTAGATYMERVVVGSPGSVLAKQIQPDH